MWAAAAARIETEFETEKCDLGLDEYETRTRAGWHHHIAMCLLATAFLLTLQQDWRPPDAPDPPRTSCTALVRELVAKERFDPDSTCGYGSQMSRSATNWSDALEQRQRRASLVP